MSASKIELLIVDDDEYLQEDLQTYFTERGYSVAVAGNAEQALAAVDSRVFSVAVVDMFLPDSTGMELLKEFQRRECECEVVMLTGQGTIESAVEAMKVGAADFLTKPVRMKELDAVIQRAAETFRIKQKNRQLRGIVERNTPRPATMIGESEAMQGVYRLIERAGPTDKTVLIQGESGTGKELVARALHAASHIADQPLIDINCAALPEQLLESEMFGHEKGAFTGATASKQGLFEIADGGTLFIDELGELALPLQAKLLRVLEDGTFRRVGSTKQRRADVRIIAATNRDLRNEAEQGRFREDLYYRINILTISLPPLRARERDVPLLLRKFAGPAWEFEPGLITALERYSWPGNVRQLKNAVDRAQILAEDNLLELKNFPEEIQRELSGEVGNDFSAPVELGQLTRQHIEQIYVQQDRNKTKTARALGVSRRTLYRLLEKYRIED
ncbi:sigma-54-dependent transcriptional regulator [Rubinisphaera sp. JC750]|uniref:sigma-54-dependent transcriptional regulator n=1 Tax=Rubinisphaera sp. JC750 TaxID=2898658 RepID=UPI001F1F2DAB|nr:sigma-54 dependent transcriptional regulator [Rubinisphaera sp. JC750]